jgi:hypothetical protein
MSEHPVIAILDALTVRLSRGPVVSEPVIAMLGEVLPFPGSGVRVTPRDACLRRVDVFADRDSGFVSGVCLALAEQTQLQLSELMDHFGTATVMSSVSMLEDGRYALIFLPDQGLSLVAGNRDFFDMEESSLIGEVTVRVDEPPLGFQKTSWPQSPVP